MENEEIVPGNANELYESVSKIVIKLERSYQTQKETFSTGLNIIENGIGRLELEIDTLHDISEDKSNRLFEIVKKSDLIELDMEKFSHLKYEIKDLKEKLIQLLKSIRNM
ncbi:hypothetical protein RF11_04628 [Thelohanellus kitauei]|uniref:Uncharacterized protein n=1 Tax=Thelohanellus kitauei TaxID=669202 RepID=A0A0C2MR91_THEKT|nr:hypothetical protein RF11_04628 [Thelohanellus kitauei]